MARQRTVLVCPPKTCLQCPVVRSQIRNVWSEEPLTKKSLVASRARIPPSCPTSVFSSSPVSGLWIRMVWSSEAVMMRLEEKRRQVMIEVPCAGKEMCLGCIPMLEVLREAGEQDFDSERSQRSRLVRQHVQSITRLSQTCCVRRTEGFKISNIISLSIVRPDISALRGFH